jgi:hypothetical protein
MSLTSFWTQYRDELLNDPLLVLGLTAALIAMASTPLAFAVLGRLDWFKARRGRVMQRPEFASIVAAMVMVMGVPAIFSALVLKSRSFDKNRYEFDPNKTWSVLEQGRGFDTVKQADAAVKVEMERLAFERKNLVDNVKKLDESMLALRAVAGTSPLVAQRFPSVLQSLAGVRKSVGVDGPQQLMDETAPPADLRALAAAGLTVVPAPANTIAAAVPATAPVIAAITPAAPAGNGMSPVEIETELAAVPAPQKPLAALLPLEGLPAGWTVGKSGDHHIETFNAENLFEKIDGRAESFIQYSVKGMAYTFYHPMGDPSNELQLYIFEMPDSLRAFGKYGSEKPDEAQPVSIGDAGYTTAGSTLFYAGRYYTQIISTQDDPKFAAFAIEIAKRVAARQKPGGAETKPVVAAAPAPAPGGAAKPAAPALPAPVEVGPATFFAMLPTQNRQGDAKYVAQDVFGYSFLSDVFMADYKEGDVTWQGFLRPYRDAKEAAEVFEKYVAGAKKDGAEIKLLKADGIDQIVESSNIGLTDVVFRKGNTIAGANGATVLAPAEAFARTLAKSLPAKVPTVGSSQ